MLSRRFPEPDLHCSGHLISAYLLRFGASGNWTLSVAMGRLLWVFYLKPVNPHQSKSVITCLRDRVIILPDGGRDYCYLPSSSLYAQTDLLSPLSTGAGHFFAKTIIEALAINDGIILVVSNRDLALKGIPSSGAALRTRSSQKLPWSCPSTRCQVCRPSNTYWYFDP
ncbi:uncharacterized protein BT62DRAFT_928952 [Guyanagaster necrorhizus]|uniref:Uncharacterized protein n=1 Tax=Guyanagaster necrorhizus TaxID=856835 RepID=A0A9P7VYJ5_9AGAR|nr:uncharacterized protein BT62DRAFT_928952 [Guyanagaster necrorhizus MCA 3950]KAG7448943.1 hypothetical protein BT62DRAFT_928952 [Guyanagaster necrorhizus MCA 3950]